jgi:2-polyprenyl-6-methoxyphenol hydroxylase-like FAD-dependent oxidoreductase
VERDVEFVSLAAQGSGERGRFRHQDGTLEIVAARFVLGEDGLRSRVRQERAIAFDGEEHPASFVLAHVSLSWPLPFAEVQLFFAEQGLVVIAPLPGGRRRIVATMDDAPAQPTVADVQRILDDR